MSSSSSAATAPPWADLLPELCDLVMEHLDPITILRFPAVCRGWSEACEENPRLLRAGAPALLTPGLDPDGCETESNVDAGAFCLHDVSAAGGGGGRRSFFGEAEGLKGRAWVGGNHGWLATADWRCDVELLNPVTGARVRLPSFATIPGVEVEVNFHVVARTAGGYSLGKFHKILKVALCRTPSHADGHLAIAIFSGGLLAFTAAGGGDKGECRWTALKNAAADVSYMDAIALDGKLYAVDELGRLYSWDIDDGAMTEPTVVQGPENDEMSRYGTDLCGFYLAASVCGQRLMLMCIHGYDVARAYLYGRRSRCWDSRVWSRLVFDDRRSFCELGMSLHELDAGGGSWRRVTDLGGDRALFLGANYPFYLTVRHRFGSADLEADCVYLADTPYGYDTAIFDLKEGTGGDGHIKQQLYYSLEADPLQMPMWFVPTDYPH